jgi:hypothetical protein
MRQLRYFTIALAALATLAPSPATAQWGVMAKAALPAVPYWWTPGKSSTGLLPLLWTNDIDGGSNGCCVIGAAGRQHLGEATLWLALGFGSDPKGGTPAAIEVAAEINQGAVAFRSLHGRSGFSAFYSLPGLLDPQRNTRVSLGASSVWLFDERYLEELPFFDCADAPAVPCELDPTPYPWSEGQDNAILAEGARGEGTWGAPRLTGSLGVGLKAVGGDYGYVRAELAGEAWGRFDGTGWMARLAGGWVSGGSPMERRFLLYGADPVTRWLNPYIEARGALFSDIPYVVPGGPNLRAYAATQPLVESFLGALGQVSRGGETSSGLWGRVDAFLEAAWIPGIPDRLGPEQLNEDGDFLFDWRELPEGEDEAQGRFMARVLEVSKIWADAGITLTGGYRNVAVAVAFPLWASEPAFADEPIGGGEKKAFAARWTLTVLFFPKGRPEVQ